MLLEYLQDYTDRVKPLQDQNELFGKIQTEFEKKWENGTFPGWPVSFPRVVCLFDYNLRSGVRNIWPRSHPELMELISLTLPQQLQAGLEIQVT